MGAKTCAVVQKLISPILLILEALTGIMVETVWGE